jgi:hypothetical protein
LAERERRRQSRQSADADEARSDVTKRRSPTALSSKAAKYTATVSAPPLAAAASISDRITARCAVKSVVPGG